MRKKIILLIEVIIISSVFIIGIYIPSIEESKKSYIATDDTYYSGVDNNEIVNGNKISLIAGRYNTNTSSSFYYTFIKFDLRNKPEVWNIVEISLYIYEYKREEYWLPDANIWLLFNDWNEHMNHGDIKDSLPTWSGGDFYWEHNLGLHRINITNYIGDNEIITIRIGAHGTYRVGTQLRDYNNYVMIYSKEANVNKDYLPQLIWS